ncbi:SAF domain-containing protein [Bacillus dakarensis]|uniref:SAF domain-containing protein n=1 Tax=Robertmurraya dakarensis TaxID=1926278 RepID=UPI000982117B|nr:SAF domain-containing protein [Bacillus dakarensis]
MLESKRRAIIFITISILLAVIAGFMFLMKVNEMNESLGGTTKVYAANKDINPRTIIAPEDIKVIDLPNKYFVEGSYIKVDDAEDITNQVSIVSLKEDTIITRSVLKEFSNVGDPNNRLVRIVRGEKVLFDEVVENNDLVDIIVSHQFDGSPKTEIFMSDVTVFRAITSDDKFAGVDLEVAKEDAPKLIHMQNYADSIRVLKASGGQEEPKKEAPKEEKSEQKPTAPAAQPEKPQEKSAPQPQQQTPTQPAQQQGQS